MFVVSGGHLEGLKALLGRASTCPTLLRSCGTRFSVFVNEQAKAYSTKNGARCDDCVGQV
jgi:hypothetical protein